MIGYIALAAFIATIPAANWLIGNAGTVCAPNGPCLIPVAPGIMAPSGVLMMTRKEIDRWDFPRRNLMHRVAKALAS